tara:strand:+ start:849 stop:1127 length:279 start_codon:yes stop_codon:yes gene_type:complete
MRAVLCLAQNKSAVSQNVLQLSAHIQRYFCPAPRNPSVRILYTALTIAAARDTTKASRVDGCQWSIPHPKKLEYLCRPAHNYLKDMKKMSFC